jgi:hypothetical protein
MRPIAFLMHLIALLCCLGMASCQPQGEGRAPGPKGESAGDRRAGDRTSTRRPPIPVSVSAAAFSPDNKYVLTGYTGGAKLLTLWEVATGKEVRSFSGHTDCVTGVCFVAGGKHALSGSRNGWLLVHDIVTGGLLQRSKAYQQAIRTRPRSIP